MCNSMTRWPNRQASLHSRPVTKKRSMQVAGSKGFDWGRHRVLYHTWSRLIPGLSSPPCRHWGTCPDMGANYAESRVMALKGGSGLTPRLHKDDACRDSLSERPIIRWIFALDR